MTLAKVIVLILTIVMGVTLVYGFTQGDLSADGAGPAVHAMGYRVAG